MSNETEIINLAKRIPIEDFVNDVLLNATNNSKDIKDLLNESIKKHEPKAKSDNDISSKIDELKSKLDELEGKLSSSGSIDYSKQFNELKENLNKIKIDEIPSKTDITNQINEINNKVNELINKKINDTNSELQKINTAINNLASKTEPGKGATPPDPTKVPPQLFEDQVKDFVKLKLQQISKKGKDKIEEVYNAIRAVGSEPNDIDTWNETQYRDAMGVLCSHEYIDNFKFEGGSPFPTSKIAKYMNENIRSEISVLKYKKEKGEEPEFYLKLLKIYSKNIDFHKWYDDTSSDFTYNVSSESVNFLTDFDKSKKIEDTSKASYGGYKNLEVDMFYRDVYDDMISMIGITNPPLSIHRPMNALTMYCLGKNVSYWLAKRYMLISSGDIKLDDKDTIRKLIKEKSFGVTPIKVITDDLYNQHIESITKNPDSITITMLKQLYQYDLLNGIADISNKIIETTNLKFDDNSITDKKLLKLLFERHKNKFIRENKKTVYEKRDWKSPKYADPISITSIIKQLSNDPERLNLEERSKYLKFFNTNTIKQLAATGALTGGKMFCGGAAVENNMFNGSKLYKNIFDSIISKMNDKGVHLNPTDKEKIEHLIETTSNYENKLYEILSTLNKFVSSDISNKFHDVNYSTIAKAVEDYEKVFTKYSRKSFILYKDLYKIYKYIGTVVRDSMN